MIVLNKWFLYWYFVCVDLRIGYNEEHKSLTKRAQQNDTLTYWVQDPNCVPQTVISRTFSYNLQCISLCGALLVTGHCYFRQWLHALQATCHHLKSVNAPTHICVTSSWWVHCHSFTGCGRIVIWLGRLHIGQGNGKSSFKFNYIYGIFSCYRTFHSRFLVLNPLWFSDIIWMLWKLVILFLFLLKHIYPG